MTSEPTLVSLEVAVVQHSHSHRFGVLFDYWTLTKPEINFLIVMTTAAAFCLDSTEATHFPWLLFLHTVLGTVLVSSGASTLNQVIERHFDAKMRRTARRPVAAGRIEPSHAKVFGTLLSVAGGVDLAVAVRPAASLLALLTLGWYLFFYTPLKRRTPICTLVGAFSGAMPVLIGYVAATGKFSSQAWLLYAILFLWQFPHFMAIAWMYREDYDRAGYEILPQGKDKTRFMQWQSVLPALALVPTSVAWLILQQSNYILVVASLLLSLSFLYFASRLAGARSNGSARQLLLVSIVYLPMVFALQVLTRI
jgi:protoheme IX farnesyltransferase